MKELEEDLEHVLIHTRNVWEKVKGKTIFVTGGTGFFGIWLQMSFLHINRVLNLGSKLVLLTRSKESFLSKYSLGYQDGEVEFIEGDICTFEFPPYAVDYIIHAATEASVKLNLEEPLVMFETVVNGTKRILELAREKQVKGFLLTSSGAVYGTQPSEITHVPEGYIGAPLLQQSSSMYGEGKRMSEVLCAAYAEHFNIPVKIARCFAFLGPFLPLDTHFAAGNFIKSVLSNVDINISGDGTPYRSYMYPSDLMIWLWTILFNGKNNEAYNVGSDEAVNIEELAYKVIAFAGVDFDKTVQIAGTQTGAPPLRYVPNVDKAKKELSLKILIDLSLSIKKTVTFHKTNNE